MPALSRMLAAAVTPMLPDDVVNLVNPLFSTKELRARVLEIRPETADSATIVLRPGKPFPTHQAGQYVRIGVDINGVRNWRTYSLTSTPGQETLEITVKAIPDGLVSHFLVHSLKPGAIVRLDG